MGSRAAVATNLGVVVREIVASMLGRRGGWVLTARRKDRANEEMERLKSNDELGLYNKQSGRIEFEFA